MFETIKKAKQVGVVALERVDDYMELMKVSGQIQAHNLKGLVIRFAVAGLFAVLSLVFLGIAVIVTCWDTAFRVAAAWGVVAFYALVAVVAVMSAQNRPSPVSAFDTLRDELRQDIKLMKDVV